MHRLIRKPLVRLNDRIGRRFGFKLRKITHSRPSTLKALEIFGDRPLRALEIGCAAGNNALDVLNRLNISEYVVVDPYEMVETEYADYNRPRLARMRQESHDRLRAHAAKIRWVYKESLRAIPDLQGRFDYIYVDGDHSYAAVVADMDAYYRLLADRFVFGGHDVDRPEVARAFVDFVSSRGIANYEIKDPDWIIHRP